MKDELTTPDIMSQDFASDVAQLREKFLAAQHSKQVRADAFRNFLRLLDVCENVGEFSIKADLYGVDFVEPKYVCLALDHWTKFASPTDDNHMFVTQSFGLAEERLNKLFDFLIEPEKKWWDIIFSPFFLDTRFVQYLEKQASVVNDPFLRGEGSVLWTTMLHRIADLDLERLKSWKVLKRMSWTEWFNTSFIRSNDDDITPGVKLTSDFRTIDLNITVLSKKSYDFIKDELEKTLETRL